MRRALTNRLAATAPNLTAAYAAQPNVWVNRATAIRPTSRASPAEQPAPSQAQNATAVAPDAPFVRRVRARPLSLPNLRAGSFARTIIIIEAQTQAFRPHPC
jgi:hypothetical protein